MNEWMNEWMPIYLKERIYSNYKQQLLEQLQVLNEERKTELYQELVDIPHLKY